MIYIFFCYRRPPCPLKLSETAPVKKKAAALSPLSCSRIYFRVLILTLLSSLAGSFLGRREDGTKCSCSEEVFIAAADRSSTNASNMLLEFPSLLLVFYLGIDNILYVCTI